MDREPRRCPEARWSHGLSNHVRTPWPAIRRGIIKYWYIILYLFHQQIKRISETKEMAMASKEHCRSRSCIDLHLAVHLWLCCPWGPQGESSVGKSNLGSLKPVSTILISESSAILIPSYPWHPLPACPRFDGCAASCRQFVLLNSAFFAARKRAPFQQTWHPAVKAPTGDFQHYQWIINIMIFHDHWSFMIFHDLMSRRPGCPATHCRCQPPV